MPLRRVGGWAASWRLDIVKPVKDWLHVLRTQDPDLLLSLSEAFSVLLQGGPGGDRRPLVDSLAGEKAKTVHLKELRAEGTIRIAFVRHGGTIVVLLAHGDKRGRKSSTFYDQMVDDAVEQYELWKSERGED